MEKNTKLWPVNQLLLWLDSMESTHYKISPIQVLILIFLYKFRNSKTNQCNPSLSRLSKATRIHRTKLPEHLKNLEENGFIKIISKTKKNGGKDNNQYELLVDKLTGGSSSQLPGVVAISYQGSSSQLPAIYKLSNQLSNLTTQQQEIAAQNKNKELKQTAKEWGPGHVGWEALHQKRK